jgi:hypothetical protein
MPHFHLLCLCTCGCMVLRLHSSTLMLQMWVSKPIFLTHEILIVLQLLVHSLFFMSFKVLNICGDPFLWCWRMKFLHTFVITSSSHTFGPMVLYIELYLHNFLLLGRTSSFNWEKWIGIFSIPYPVTHMNVIGDLVPSLVLQENKIWFWI